MKRALFHLVLFTWVLAGCQTKSHGPTASPSAFPAGAQQALPSPQQGAYVTVRGQVRNPVLPWTEGLTLAQALIQADYIGFGDPREIIVVRQGISYKVDPQRLLKGLSNGPLLPGDIVDIR